MTATPVAAAPTESAFGGDKETPCVVVDAKGKEPPSTNTYYRNFRGRMVLSPRGRLFKKEMAAMCEGMKKTEGPVRLRLDLRFRDRRRRDVDNYLKGILDAFKDRLFEDDSVVTEITVTKRSGCREDNGFVLRIYPDPE